MAVAELAPDLAGFRHYTRIKQAIASEVRTLTDFLRKRLGDEEAEECRQLMVKLAEDRFALAVVGQFKRGKSSLMNAVIGRDILPTGVLPLTSAITVLKYGPREKLTILRKGNSYTEEVPISRIAEYVTEKGNPGNAKEVACAFLELPVQFLRGGLEFVDTPGIGSAIEANTATTYDFLPQSDAVIFVTSVDTLLTRAETDFLQSIQEHDAIEYRHEVMQDLEDATLFKHVKSFAQKMRAMREHQVQADKLHYSYQKESCFLDAVEIYCDTINCFADNLSNEALKSRGFLAFLEYLASYAGSARFTSLLAETKKLKADLSALRYCVLIKGQRVEFDLNFRLSHDLSSHSR